MFQVQELNDRLIHLNDLKQEELKSWQPSKIYISDLDISIKDCETKLSFYNKNPKGFEVITK